MLPIGQSARLTEAPFSAAGQMFALAEGATANCNAAAVAVARNATVSLFTAVTLSSLVSIPERIAQTATRPVQPDGRLGRADAGQ